MNIQLSEFIKETALLNFKEFSTIYDSTATYNIKTDMLFDFITILNSTLDQLYRELPLLYKACTIELIDQKLYYPLRSDYAVSNTGSTEEKYIQDTVEQPFYPYLIKILKVTDKCGNAFSINNSCDTNSIHLPEFDTLFYTNYDYVSDFINVIYQANHIPLINADYETQYLTFPYMIKDLVRYLFLYKFYANKLGDSFTKHAQKYYQMYSELLLSLKDSDFVQPSFSEDSTSKLTNRGFV